MSEYHMFVTRVEDNVREHIIIQSNSKEHARTVLETTVLGNNEKVMYHKDVTEDHGEESLQEFINEHPDGDLLVLTGGRGPKTLYSNDHWRHSPK